MLRDRCTFVCRLRRRVALFDLDDDRSSCGTLGTADWTAHSALGQKSLNSAAATVITVSWWLLVLPFLLLFILLNNRSADCRLALWIRALSNTLSSTVLEDSLLLADDPTSLDHLFHVFWMDAFLSFFFKHLRFGEDRNTQLNVIVKTSKLEKI